MAEESPQDNKTNEGFSIGKGQAEYKPEDLQHLSDLEHVRERPSMYIGDTTSRGLHHLVFEVVDNSVDEALAGYCSEIHVIINSDGSLSVEDNGRIWIPSIFTLPDGLIYPSIEQKKITLLEKNLHLF